MSKLEDKLTASIKPGKAAPAPARGPRKVAEKPAAARPAADVPKPVPKPANATRDPSETARFLHPRRVWPD